MAPVPALEGSTHNPRSAGEQVFASSGTGDGGGGAGSSGRGRGGGGSCNAPCGPVVTVPAASGLRHFNRDDFDTTVRDDFDITVSFKFASGPFDEAKHGKQIICGPCFVYSGEWRGARVAVSGNRDPSLRRLARGLIASGGGPLGCQ